jgi:hypothetical protein
MPIPSDGTTFSHNIKEDGNAIRTNGEHPRWTTPYQKNIQIHCFSPTLNYKLPKTVNNFDII